MVLNVALGRSRFQDRVAGVDYLMRRASRSPALGRRWMSYGGYMAEWAITQTSRFKAAVSGAGMSDLAPSSAPKFIRLTMKGFYGLPYEKPDGFRTVRRSHTLRMRTPQR